VDTVIGKEHQGVLVTSTERKSRFSLLHKVDFKRSELMADAVFDLLA
jgi:IS30 family transposase